MGLENITFLEDEATADIAFLAKGKNIDEAFANAGIALFHVIVDNENIKRKIEVKQRWEAEDLKGLLYDYLNDLIFLFDTKKILLGEINAKIYQEKKNNYILEIIGLGEKYNPKTHQAKTHIKAMTFFGMEISENSVKVTLDI
ncbi:MAG: archease [Candidatus Thorarchaeota archaeon]